MIPTRRENTILTIPWRNSVLTLCFGYVDGEAMEVFGDIGKPGTDLNHLVHDICRSMSKELADGTPPEEFAARAMRDAEGNHVSIFGVIADALCAEQATHASSYE